MSGLGGCWGGTAVLNLMGLGLEGGWFIGNGCAGLDIGLMVEGFWQWVHGSEPRVAVR